MAMKVNPDDIADKWHAWALEEMTIGQIEDEIAMRSDRVEILTAQVNGLKRALDKRREADADEAARLGAHV